MFERETETIISIAKQRIPHSITDSSAFAVKDILAADIPLPLKTFFRADVEILLMEELGRQRKKSRFSFSHPEVQSLQSQMNSFLVLHYSFKKEEFHQRLDDAVHLLVNYLVRPQWTLANVIFEQGDTISTSALMRLLKYFGPYEYIRSLLLRFIEDRHSASFTKADFSKILWRVDGEFIRRKTGDQLAKLLTPMYEFLEYPLNTGTNKLPLKALIKYFGDKGLTMAVKRLEDEIALGTNEITAKDLGEVLESIRRNSGAFEVASRTIEIDPAKPPSVEPTRVEAHREIEPTQNVVTPQPPPTNPPPGHRHSPLTPPSPAEGGSSTWGNRSRGEKGEIIAEETGSDSLPPLSDAPEEPWSTTDAPATVQEEEPPQALGQGEESVPAQSGHGGEKQPYLLYAINDGDRKKFVKKIFVQDDIAFLEALRALDEMSTWRQASVYIDEIFIKNDVDPYASEAIRFIDVIQEKYYPKK